MKLNEPEPARPSRITQAPAAANAPVATAPCNAVRGRKARAVRIVARVDDLSLDILFTFDSPLKIGTTPAPAPPDRYGEMTGMPLCLSLCSASLSAEPCDTVLR